MKYGTALSRMFICSISLGHFNSKKGGMNAQNMMRTDAIAAEMAAGTPASRPVANIAGRITLASDGSE